MSKDPFKALTVTYAEGELIVGAGEAGACMFVVQRGAVRLTRPVPEREPVEVAVLEKGDFFGEGALLESKPYGIDARAASECDVVEIGASTLQRMLKANPEIAVRLLRKLSSRVASMESKLYSRQAISDPSPATLPPVSPAVESNAVPGGEAVASPAPLVAEPLPLAAPDPAPPPAPIAPPVPIEPAVKKPKNARFLVEGGGASFALGGSEVLIGRYDPITELQPEIDLSSADTKRSVSRRHARATLRGETWYLSEEIGALNGTFVNGVKLRPGAGAPLADNDVVSVGMVRLIYRES